MNLKAASPKRCEWTILELYYPKIKPYCWFRSVVAYNHKLYIFGGQDHWSFTLYSEFYEIDIFNRQCKEMPSCPNARSEHSCIVYNDKMVVVAGCDQLGYVSNQVLDYFDFSKNKWEKWSTTGAILPKAAQVQCVLIDHTIYVCGVSEQHIFALDCNSLKWKQILVKDNYFGLSFAFEQELYTFWKKQGILRLHTFNRQFDVWTRVEVKECNWLKQDAGHHIVLYGNRLFVVETTWNDEVSARFYCIKLPRTKITYKFDMQWVDVEILFA